MPPVTNQMRPVDSTSDQLYVVFQGNDEASLKKAVSLLKEKYKIQRAESNVAHFLPKNGNEANLKEHGQPVAQEDEDVYVFKVNQTKNEKQKPFLQLSFFAWFQPLLKNAFYGQWHHSASFHNERKYKPGAKFQSNVLRQG
ncbi:hypothetical protein IPH67_05620 [bacterium]|nr:MAG: hypothetical protein IPH67_05620 [bacterium]